ncbi:MAG: hypothetical protein ACK47E_01715 [Cyclobacteriaceae bacterium]|jgi:hypothetical protein
MSTFAKICFVIFLFEEKLAVCQSKKAVIEKFIQAVGGRERWLSIRTEIDSGMIIEYKSEGVFEKSRIDTTFFKTITVYPNKQKFTSYEYKNDPILGRSLVQYSTCFNGTYLWTGSPGKIRVQSPEESESFKNTITLGLPGLFLLDKTAEVEYIGTEKLNNKNYEVLKIKGTNNFFYQLVYFDPLTGLEYCTVGYDTPIKRFNYSTEYRYIDNVAVAVVGENFVDGVLKGKTVILSVELNKAVDDSTFSEFK